MNFNIFLEKIVSNDYEHALWLNTLSYLEYRGLRKIVKSQMTKDISIDILKHCNEEIGHAFYLKSLAIKLGGSNLAQYTNENMVSAVSFKKYFYNLDYEISKIKSINHYFATSLAIEMRATKIYNQYEKILKRLNHKISIRNIINDENNHLWQFSNKTQANDIKILKEIEKKCFNNLCREILL